MALDQQRLSPAERANLVAYLDGELNEAESRAIATKLTQSATARREVETLERTWELLDHLSRPTVSVEFTERTLSSARQINAQGTQFDAAFQRAFRLLTRCALWLAMTFVAFGVGYALVFWAWPNPTARLTRDLSLAEHFDEYQDVQSFDFLKQLVQSSEFTTDLDD